MIVWNTVEQDARVRKEAQSLARVGYEVTVFGLLNYGVTPTIEKVEDRFTIHRVQRSFEGLFSNPSKSNAASDGALKRNYFRISLLVVSRCFVHLVLLWRLIRSKADIIHAHDVNTLPTAWLAARLSNSALVYDAHEVSTGREGYQKLKRLIAVVEKCLMPRADASITTTRLRAAFFSRAYGVATPAILQNRPRLESADARHVTGRDENQLRTLLKLKMNWPIVLYQGGLQQGRGLKGLLDCAERVEDAYFVFIGGGRLAPVLKEQAAKSSASSRIHFVSTVPHDELFDLTASADIGVQALENTCFNHYSTDSNKLFEYMHAGLAIISSDFPIIRDVIEQSDCGILVPSGDVTALQKAISKVVKDKRLRTQMQKNAINARKDFTWEGQENVLLDLYRKIAP